MTELKVCIKADDLNITEKYMEYSEGICLSPTDPTLRGRVHETFSKITPSPIDPEIIIKVQYLWDNIKGGL